MRTGSSRKKDGLLSILQKLLWGFPPEDTSYAEYMDLSIALMRQCNCVFMLPGWENSKGARFENDYAKFCGMAIYEEDADRNIQLRN